MHVIEAIRSSGCRQEINSNRAVCFCNGEEHWFVFYMSASLDRENISYLRTVRLIKWIYVFAKCVTLQNNDGYVKRIFSKEAI